MTCIGFECCLLCLEAEGEGRLRLDSTGLIRFVNKKPVL